jgi:phospholipid transport system transporter-binding protein
MRIEAGVAFLQGDLILDNATRLLAECEAALSEGVDTFDLAGVAKLDSSAISLLLALRRRAAGKSLQFHHVPESLTSLTRLYGLDDQF